MTEKRRLFGPLAGAALLATGRRRGMERFGDTTQAFLASLAPLVAFPLVGAGLLTLTGRMQSGLLALLLTLVAQLAPPVVSHMLAVRWGREAEWLRYATAFNWCQWALPVAAFVMLLVLQLFAGGRMTEEQAAEVLILGLTLYVLWFHWFIARHGLALGRLRAAGLVFLVNAATAALIMGPRLLRGLMQDPPG